MKSILFTAIATTVLSSVAFATAQHDFPPPVPPHPLNVTHWVPGSVLPMSAFEHSDVFLPTPN